MSVCIDSRDTPRDSWHVWGTRPTRSAARKSAIGLCAALKIECGLTRPAVRVGGREIITLRNREVKDLLAEWEAYEPAGSGLADASPDRPSHTEG